MPVCGFGLCVEPLERLPKRLEVVTTVLTLLFRGGEIALGQTRREQDQTLEREFDVVSISVADREYQEVDLAMGGGILGQNSSRAAIALSVGVIVIRPEVEHRIHSPAGLVTGEENVILPGRREFSFVVHRGFLGRSTVALTAKRSKQIEP
jgi:hypothetical protein